MNKLLISFLFIFISLSAQARWVDGGSQVFYTSETSEILFQYKDFPTSWWNFIFFKESDISREKVCNKIKALNPDYFYFNGCESVPVPNQWVKDWIRDFPLRSSPLSLKQLNFQLDKSLARLSLPLSPQMFELIRQDPLSAGEAFLQIFQQFYGNNENENGPWQWIPLQMSFSHEKVDQSALLMKKIANPQVQLMGPHFAAVQNRQRITADLRKVLSVGLFFITLLVIFLLMSRRWVFCLALPVLLFSIFMASLLTIFYWGSIHGLTLAFGSALIGISMDYAFHGLMKKHQTMVWRANALSFITTFIALLMLCLFDIPLIQQMGMFSALGLGFSFSLLYLLSRFLPQGRHAKPLLQRKFSRYFPLTVTLIPFLGIALTLGLLFVEQDYSLRNFDYSLSKKSKLIDQSQPLREKLNYAMLIQENHREIFNTQNSNWARKHNITSIGLASFSLPSLQEKKNLEKWIKWSCNEVHLSWKFRLSPETRNLFSEFFNIIDCHSLKTRLNNYPPQRSYLQPFLNQDKNIFILKGRTDREKQLISEKFPQAFYLKEKIAEFPQLIKKQTHKVFGWILAISALILIIALRSWAPLALLPMLGGSGLTFGYHLLMGTSMSFMSFIGLIILLGLTLDYGIFVTMKIAHGHPIEDVWGALALSGLTSLAGFTPLILCLHPALHDLGITLFTGIIGALLTSFFVIPEVASWFIAKDSQNV